MVCPCYSSSTLRQTLFPWTTSDVSIMATARCTALDAQAWVMITSGTPAPEDAETSCWMTDAIEMPWSPSVPVIFANTPG